MALVQQPTSAANLLALLEEDDDSLRLYALQALDRVVHDFWFQIASAITSVEAFYDDEDFIHRELAALVASKVFYHLGELNDALTYALGAGALFDTNEQSEYVQTILSSCIDRYVEMRRAEAEGREAVVVDQRLTVIVERLFSRCFTDGQFEQAVGIALETRRLDKLEEAVHRSPDTVGILTYALRVSQDLVVSREFRFEVLRLLIKLYESVESPDWVSICQCLMFLDDAAEVAKILERLLKGSEDDALLAYQVCFDLFENEQQAFSLQVWSLLEHAAPRLPQAAPDAAAHAADAGAADAALPAPAAPPAPTGATSAGFTGVPAGAAPAAAAAQLDAASEPTGGPEAAGLPAGGPAGAAAAAAADSNGRGAEPMDTDGLATLAVVAHLSPEEHAQAERWSKLHGIITGVTPISLYLEFLSSHNHADRQILKNMKAVVEVRNSVCHSAVIFANAVMHAGTTVDAFLRESMDWLTRATNWAKFSATAGLGVIHRGHLAQGRNLMAPYLPPSASGSPYSEGGALYALGLIHTNHGQAIRGFLLESLRSTSHEVTQHGACLGLGLAALGTGDEEVFEDLKGVLYTDSAVAGEAAGLALGLLCVGSASDKAGELLAYAHDTQHEKIIRGVALGLAFIMYAREEGAETLVEQMTRDQDPILRFGGMYVIGLAYRGTANNAAVQKLLHFAVADVSDDVRRAAVLCLGFVLMGVPEQCPRIVALLAESYNPHLRYGAAMAVGVACAGTGMRAATDLLEPLLSDAVDFVRQGALIASALVLMQQPEAKVAALRKRVERVVGDKHEEAMARMGAIMAAGLLDAGGRNATPALRSHSGYFRRTSVVALALFTQYWYWYPLSYCISLALQPAALIGLNGDLRLPAFSVVCKCKPSLFAYPPPVTQEAAAAAAKVPTAVLSTSVRARDKAKKKEKKKAEATADAPVDAPAAMETDDSAAAAGPKEGGAGDGGAAARASANGVGTSANGARTKEAPEEPASCRVDNPGRVVPAQERFVELDPAARWVPIKPQRAAAGILVLKDRRPGEPVELVSAAAAPAPVVQQTPAPAPAPTAAPAAPARGAPPSRNTDDEVPPPEPFEYTPP
ncbi:hypothetical protein WJX81_001983 [Elliptochloris bilobata]|uniref:26S proteasome non-ATPase regulatory subunit 1 homolog n=1 Tax=Elliptochloris bilobata TaxID=381761 RepID=A0AAW1SDH6_9CHLO